MSPERAAALAAWRGAAALVQADAYQAEQPSLPPPKDKQPDVCDHIPSKCADGRGSV